MNHSQGKVEVGHCRPFLMTHPVCTFTALWLSLLLLRERRRKRRRLFLLWDHQSRRILFPKGAKQRRAANSAFFGLSFSFPRRKLMWIVNHRPMHFNNGGRVLNKLIFRQIVSPFFAHSFLSFLFLFLPCWEKQLWIGSWHEKNEKKEEKERETVDVVVLGQGGKKSWE